MPDGSHALANELEEEWHKYSHLEITLHAYMGLSAVEYGAYVARGDLPRDFMERHS